MSETKDDVEVTASLPGFEAKDLEVRVKDDILSICGRKREGREEKKHGYHFLTRSFSNFRRWVRLPMSVDSKQKAEALFQDGVLRVRLAKASN